MQQQVRFYSIQNEKCMLIAFWILQIAESHAGSTEISNYCMHANVDLTP